MTLWKTLTLAFTGATLGLGISQAAEARDCGIGQTIFMDTVYGMGAGTLVGGLWMVANMDDTKGNDVIPSLATAALIGGGVGAIIGVVEVGLCAGDRGAKSTGLQIPTPTLMAFRNAAGENGLSPGITFRYKFN